MQNRVSFGAATQIRTGDLILTNYFYRLNSALLLVIAFYNFSLDLLNPYRVLFNPFSILFEKQKPGIVSPASCVLSPN